MITPLVISCPTKKESNAKLFALYFELGPNSEKEINYWTSQLVNQAKLMQKIELLCMWSNKLSLKNREETTFITEVNVENIIQ